MKFKLPRQIFNATLHRVISREMRKKKNFAPPVSKDNLKQIATIVKEIEKRGLPKYLVCRKLSNNLGHGIFLHPDAKPILKGQVIAPYAGEIYVVPQNEPDETAYAFAPLEDILLSKQEQAILDSKRKYHPRRLYAFEINAEKTGNFTRFINHSEKPNVAAKLLKVLENPYGVKSAPVEIVYIAKKTINPGEQLLVSYEGEEKSYWGFLDIKPFPMVASTYMLNRNLKVVATA